MAENPDPDFMVGDVVILRRQWRGYTGHAETAETTFGSGATGQVGTVIAKAHNRLLQIHWHSTSAPRRLLQTEGTDWGSEWFDLVAAAPRSFDSVDEVEKYLDADTP